MSRVQVDAGIPLRREQPQTQVVDTFVGLRAPGPQQFQPSELPRWQSELFDVAQAMSGLSGSLDSLSRTWGKIGTQMEEQVGTQMVAEMTPEQQRDASAMSWAELEKKNPQLKGASPFRQLAIRQAAGKAAITQNLGKVLADNAERLSDPSSTEDARSFGASELQKLTQGISTFYGREAATQYGSDMVEKFAGMVEETKRKRTVLVNNQNFETEVKDALSERLAAEAVFTPEGLSDAIKSIQDKYYTITGESGNIAVMGATESLAETLIANGRYDDARELVRGMAQYSHNGQVKFGKVYAEQFAKIEDKADAKELEGSRAARQDDAYRLSQAATSALFNIDGNKMQAMTEGEIKALAQEAVGKAGLGPEYFGEMYDSILQIRDSQLQRLNRGKEAETEDLRLMMDIRRESTKPGVNLDALEEKVQAAYTTGQLKRDTTIALLGQIDNARNHYGDNASPLVREQRTRLGAWMNPQTIPNTAVPEFLRITSDLQAEFDERVIAARTEVIEELNAKKVPVNADSINQFLGNKARVIADEIMQRSEKDFASFRDKYEPRARFKEYSAASPMLNQIGSSIANQMESMSREAASTGNTAYAEALESDKFNAMNYFRKIAQKKLDELAAQGLSGQELYDAVDNELTEEYRRQSKYLLHMSAGKPFNGKPTDSSDWPFWRSVAQVNRVDAERGQPSPVPEEFAGITQAGAFGNKFRSWIEELNTQDVGDLADARVNAIKAADAFVSQVGNPRTNNITIQGSNIMRGGVVDQDATATYWNAKVKWSGLTAAEVKSGRTAEGVTIPEAYWISRHTRIKGLDTQASLRDALAKFEAGQGGPLAEYMDALPKHYEARDVVDLLRTNLDEIGITE
jgi:hypothetical protein